MISLSDPSLPLDRALLEARGGFAWWYADLVDEAGDGVVLIWSFGLPFLPGITAGDGVAAGSRPSLNVCVYRGGACALWLLQEYDPDEVSWEDGTERCRFGRSAIERESDGTVCRVHATLDCPLPGTSERLGGTFALQGPAVRHAAAEPGPHQWTPLSCAATGEANLHVGTTSIAKMRGRAYHDRNGSTVPLHRLGIDHWIWGRASLGAEERIWYLLWPEGGGAPRAVGLEVAADGVLRGPFDLDVALSEPRRAVFGLRWWRTIGLSRAGTPWLEVVHEPPVEDGPFYLRFLVRLTSGGVGWGEAVRPDRVDVPWMRPFVGMRVHRAQGGNVPLVSLFTGRREGRVARLLGVAR